MKLFYLNGCNSIHDFRFLYKFIEKEYETHAITFEDVCKRVKGIEYHKISFPNLFLREPRKLRKAKKELLKLINKYKPDIINAGWIPTYGFLAAYTNNHPLLQIPMGSDILLKPYDFNNLKESWMSPLNKICTQFALKRADMIACDAEHVKNEIIKLSGCPKDKIRVFPVGIDLKKFNPKVNGNEIREQLGWEDKNIVIMTRSFEKIYGIEYFLRSLHTLTKKNNDDVRILLCGDGSLKNDFEKYIHAKKLSKYVHFVGRIENDDLPKYLAASDVYVSTSLSDGTSLSLLEAMAVGLPCVVTDVPSIMEWVTDGVNGFIVPKKNSIVVAEKIIELLKSEDLRDKFSRINIKISQERADWDKNFKKLEEIYNKLLTSN